MHPAKESAALREHTNVVRCIALAADGKSLVSGSDDLTVKVWDVAQGKVRLTLRGHDSRIEFVAITPDAKTAASADQNGVIRLWDTVTGHERFRFKPPGVGLSMMTLSANGRTLVAATNDDRVELWDVASGQLQASLAYPTERCWSLAISPNTRFLAWGDRQEDKRLRLFDIPSGKEWALPREEKDVAPQIFSLDSKTLVVIVHSADTIELLEVATGKSRSSIQSVGEGDLQALALHPGGRILAAGYRQGTGAIRLWDLATGNPAGELAGGGQGIDTLTFSADGSTLASAEGPDTTIRVWDVNNFWNPRPPVAQKLTPREIESLWAELADADAAKAYQAILRLAAAPQPAAAWIGQQFKPIAAADPRRTAPLVAALGDDDFAVRDKAMGELEALSDSAGPALTQVLSTRQLFETHHRAAALLEKLEILTPDRLTAFRAVEVLELAGTPEARRALEKLAGGVPEARLTREAKASLERLANRPSRHSTDSTRGANP